MGRVLVIDGDPVMRGTIRKILEREGHDVREAGSSSEGLTLLRGGPADVVVADLNRPPQEGFTTIVELHDGAPEVRILAVSSGATAVVDTEYSGAGALPPHALLCKPFTVDQLRQAVAALLT